MTSNNLTYATAIGYGATIGQSYGMALGGTGASAIEVGIGVNSNMSGKLHVYSSTSTYDIAGTFYNSAVYGEAVGSVFSSRGIMGVSWATGTYGIGAYGSAGGAATYNYGVYGNATGATTGNYAGYFAAGDVYIQNDLGIGTTTPINKLGVGGGMVIGGGYAGIVTAPSNGLTVQGQTSIGNYSTAQYGVFGVQGAGGAQGAVVINRTDGDGMLIRFRSSGTTQGDISMAGGIVSYNAFTGSHYAWSDEKIERGTLVSFTGVNKYLEDSKESEILYGITKTQIENDSKALGSFLALQAPNIPHSTSNPHMVMAVGNGDLWVVDNGADLVPGDYLISSSTTGHAMLDNGEHDVAYVIARVAEPVNWSSETKMIDGKKHKKISVSFENMIVNHKADRLEKELDKLNEKYDKVKADVEDIKSTLNIDASIKK
jgi:hypothetical protein